MSSSIFFVLASVCVGTCVQASGLFGHHGWHHPDHSEHGDNHHDSEWGAKHGDSHGWDHGKIVKKQTCAIRLLRNKFTDT